MIRRAGPIATLVAVLAATPAPAQQAAPAATSAANPAFDAAKAAADALGPDAVAAVQRALIWTGDLNTLASGEFGKRSFDAIRAFQRRIKAPDDGILTAPQRATLDKAAKAAAAGFGMKPVTSGGVSLAYPAKLAAGRSEGRFGPKFSAPDGSVTVDVLRYPVATETADALFERLKAERPGRSVSYSLSRPDAFVITGTVDGKAFYMRFLKLPDATAGFVLGWDPKLSPGIDRLAIAMAVSLTPEGAPAGPMAQAVASAQPQSAPKSQPAPAPVGPPVPITAGASPAARDGVGVALPGGLDVVTTARLVAGCRTVATDQGTAGRVVAGDVATDLALVRLASAWPAGVAVRDAPLLVGSALTLVVEAGGHPSSSAVLALAGPGDDTRFFTVGEPLGEGAAILDEAGRLAGITRADGGVSAKPAFLAAFLRANGVDLKGEPAGDVDKAMVAMRCDPSKG